MFPLAPATWLYREAICVGRMTASCLVSSATVAPRVVHRTTTATRGPRQLRRRRQPHRRCYRVRDPRVDLELGSPHYDGERRPTHSISPGPPAPEAAHRPARTTPSRGCTRRSRHSSPRRRRTQRSRPAPISTVRPPRISQPIVLADTRHNQHCVVSLHRASGGLRLCWP